MRLRIEHVTTYRYSRPVRFGRHRLVLRPREGHDLRVEHMALRLEPDAHVTWVRDVFGNSIALADWNEPADHLNIVNDLIVERRAPNPGRQMTPPWTVPFPVRYDPFEAAITGIYQQPSFPESMRSLENWLHEHLTPRSHDAEGTMLALCELVHHAVGYQRRATHGVQTPADTLSAGRGSCRDLATLMMEAARQLGVAVRFASGYLHGTASMAGHASMHAWCEVYLPMLGWRGFDPTLGDVVGLRHVVTGVSSHPRGVMPVSGVFDGARADCLEMTAVVKTEELAPDGSGR